MPVTRVEELTGFPECLDGRVKTLHPTVHAGLLADLRRTAHRAAARRARHRAVRPAGVQPVPVRRDGGARARRSTSASSRSTSAARRWCGRRRRTTRSVAVVTSPTAYPAVHRGARATAGSRWPQRRALAARAFADIAEYDVAVAQWCAQTLAAPRTGRARRAGRRSPAWRCAGGGAALRREPAPGGRALRRPGRAARAGPGASSCTARRCPTTTTSTPTRRGGRRNDFDRAGGRHHQARQPVRHRGRRGRRRGAPQGARLRPGLRVRRRDRGQPAGHRRAGRAGRGDLHRGDRRAVL